jgi:hypothetical protein
MIDTDAEPGVKWRAADKEWHYGNGSVIEFGFCDSMENVRQYLSAEYECILIDESTEMLADWIEMIRSRLRTTKHMRDLGVNPHLLLLTNPGGPSHGYHRDRYVTTTNGGEYVAELDERDDRGRGRHRQVAYVAARVWDNPHIDPDYESNLVAIKDPVRRAQYLDGDWSVHEGQFFAEFRTDIHVVEPFEIKPEWGWPVIGGYDWGFAAPSCLLLGAVDQDRRIHIFREFYVDRHTAADQARLFRAWGIKPDYIACDPSIWRETGVGQSVSRQLMNAGMLPLRKANNDRVAGWNAVREAMALDPDTGLPGLVIHSNCENLIRTLPDLPRDKNKPEDVDCFVAGTMIETPAGPVAVENLRVGDFVTTPMGPQRVIKAEPEGGTEVARVEMSDGRVLIGTADHEIVTDRGLVQLQELKTSDPVVTTQLVEALGTWTPETRSFTRGTRTAANPAGATTSPRRGRSLATGDSPSTGTSTGTTTAPSLTAGTSTTSTATPRTTTPPTSRSSTSEPMPPTTTRSDESRSMPLAVSGSRPPRPRRSSERPSPRRTPTLQRERNRALIVEQVSSVARWTTTAQRTAATGTVDPPATSDPAPSVAPSSGARPEARTSLRLAPTSVDGSYGVETVYALTVDGCALYYANGILVTNTRTEDHAADALRYLVMSRARAAKSQMKVHKTYDQRVSDRVTGSVSSRRRVHDVLGSI